MLQKSEKIKIIFTGRYNSGEILSGPEKVAKRIFSEFQDKTDTVFIDYFFDGSQYSIYQKLFGKENIITSQNKQIVRLGLFQIILFTIKFKPQIIHVLTFERFTLIFCMLKFILRYKISYTINGVVSFENNNFRKNIPVALKIKDKITEYCLMKFSDRLFFLSEQSFEIAKKYFSISNRKIIITANGVDEVFHQVAIERQYKAKPKLNVVLIADLKRSEKGLDFFLRAVQPIKNNFIFSIIGEGVINDDQIRYFSKMPTDEFAKFLLTQDIFISVSNYDTFSITAIETMAASVIPILTKETGVSRIIINDENGFIYSYGDDESLRNHLLELKNNFQLRKMLSQNCAMIYDQFRWKDICKQYLKTFQSILCEK